MAPHTEFQEKGQALSEDRSLRRLARESTHELARLVDSLPNLRLRGLLSYDGGVQHANGFAARKERALTAIQPNVETFQAMKKAGLN